MHTSKCKAKFAFKISSEKKVFILEWYPLKDYNYPSPLCPIGMFPQLLGNPPESIVFGHLVSASSK